MQSLSTTILALSAMPSSSSPGLRFTSEAIYCAGLTGKGSLEASGGAWWARRMFQRPVRCTIAECQINQTVYGQGHAAAIVVSHVKLRQKSPSMGKKEPYHLRRDPVINNFLKWKSTRGHRTARACGGYSTQARFKGRINTLKSTPGTNKSPPSPVSKP